uniref:Uncharacterized protein n=1 Tax=Panagrolaimus sp. ES5 TaxID=591445 RepID=A0AC34F6G7_9BILA
MFLAIQINSQNSLFNLFESGAAEHGGEHGGNIHTLFKFASPSYYGSNSEHESASPPLNTFRNPYYFQQQQQPQPQIYRYPQNNFYYPQQQYYG